MGASICELATAASQVHSQLAMAVMNSGSKSNQLTRESQSSTKREHRNLEDLATILQRFGDVQIHLAKQRVNFESVGVEANILPKLQRIIEVSVSLASSHSFDVCANVRARRNPKLP